MIGRTNDIVMLTSGKKAIIINEVIHYLEPNITIIFQPVEQLKRSNSGKLKQFTSYIN